MSKIRSALDDRWCTSIRASCVSRTYLMLAQRRLTFYLSGHPNKTILEVAIVLVVCRSLRVSWESCMAHFVKNYEQINFLDLTERPYSRS